MITNEAKQKLLLLDETLILEILEINAEELLDRFEDRLLERLDDIEHHLEEL